MTRNKNVVLGIWLLLTATTFFIQVSYHEQAHGQVCRWYGGNASVELLPGKAAVHSDCDLPALSDQEWRDYVFLQLLTEIAGYTAAPLVLAVLIMAFFLALVFPRPPEKK